jgi:hypothetical protein
MKKNFLLVIIPFLFILFSVLGCQTNKAKNCFENQQDSIDFAKTVLSKYSAQFEISNEDTLFFRTQYLKDSMQNLLNKKKSDTIPLSEAIAMRSFYRTNKEHFKTIYFNSTTRKPVIDTLQGFIFKVSDIETLIKNNGGKKAKDIILYFGRDAQDITQGSKHYPSFAIITMAIDSSNKLIQKAYDKADPCPPNCPTE